MPSPARRAAWLSARFPETTRPIRLCLTSLSVSARPDLGTFRRIFERVSRQQGMSLTDEVFDAVVTRITEIKKLDLAAYMPRFIVDQLVAACRFLGQPPHFERRFIDYAVDNLRVHRSQPKGQG